MVSMEYKQDSFDDIIKSEYDMVLDGQKRYGKYYIHAINFYNFLQQFIISVDASRFIFTAFLGQIRKHHLLAILSTLRLQHTQSMMNLRQVLEASASAAYSIANPDKKGFIIEDESRIIKTTDKLRNKQYKWLDKNYKHGSDAIKRMKDLINDTSSHSNLVNAHRNFKFQSKEAHMPFFDYENEFHIKAALWQASNIVLGITNLFYVVDKDIRSIKFVDSFEKDLLALQDENNIIKTEIQKDHPEK